MLTTKRAANDFHQEPAQYSDESRNSQPPDGDFSVAGRGDRIPAVKSAMKVPPGAGAKPKAGLVGFSVSNLRIPGFEQPWEEDFGKPERIVTALDIMTEGPLGGAAFNQRIWSSGTEWLLPYL